MVNRDRTLDIRDREAAVRYDTITKVKMSANDTRVMADLIRAVNQRGYSIQYYFQLGFLDLACRDLFPVIRDHVWQFDDPEFSIRLLAYLGVPKLYEATPFLIEFFKKEKRRKLGAPHSLETTRSAAASSLLRVRDGRYQEAYRELIADGRTHTDAGLLVKLLGCFPSQANHEFLLAQLCDDDANIRIPAIQALGRYKVYAGPLIRALVDIEAKSENRDVARAARKSREKLQRAVGPAGKAGMVPPQPEQRPASMQGPPK